MSATELYNKDFLQRGIAPVLREMGFQGTRGKYFLPADGWYIYVGFQKSKYSSSNRVEFFVNYTIVSESEWAQIRSLVPAFGETPNYNVMYSRVEQGFTGRPGYGTGFDIKKDELIDGVVKEITYLIKSTLPELVTSHAGIVLP